MNRCDACREQEEGEPLQGREAAGEHEDCCRGSEEGLRPGRGRAEVSERFCKGRRSQTRRGRNEASIERERLGTRTHLELERDLEYGDRQVARRDVAAPSKRAPDRQRNVSYAR